MKYYTVDQVAEVLGKSPETIRRLLRDRNNALNAPKPLSTKAGWRIPESSLKAFLEATPKYMTKAASDLLSASSALPFVIGGIIGGVVSFISLNKKKKVTSNQIEEYIRQQIDSCQKEVKKYKDEIEKKQKKISELQAELYGINQNCEEAQNKLNNYKFALEEIDCNELADSINQNLS